MPFDRFLYPKEWFSDRRSKIAAANFACEDCGVTDRSLATSADGNPYMVHLSIAHRNQYETWKRDADTMVLCQACHRRFDRQFCRKAGTRRYHTPIGSADVFTFYQETWCLVAQPRTVDDLRDVIAALPADSVFEVCLSLFTAQVVGTSRYRKLPDDALAIECEQGACEQLRGQLEPLRVIKKRIVERQAKDFEGRRNS